MPPIYDSAGNITSKKTYAFTIGDLGTASSTVNYTYGDASWGDLLTKYGSTTIAYDAIGNPLTIGSHELTWQGREPISFQYDDYISYSFEYNADGYINANGDLIGFNMFAYCSNSPIIHIDEDGYGSRLISWLISKFHAFGACGKGGWSFNGTKYTGIIESSIGGTANNAGNYNNRNSGGGRPGGVAHQQQVQATKNALEKSGLMVEEIERRAYYTDSRYRYPDITAKYGTQTIYVQVGKVNHLGIPATREIRALMDLSTIGGVEIYFIPYNK